MWKFDGREFKNHSRTEMPHKRSCSHVLVISNLESRLWFNNCCRVCLLTEAWMPFSRSCPQESNIPDILMKSGRRWYQGLQKQGLVHKPWNYYFRGNEVLSRNGTFISSHGSTIISLPVCVDSTTTFSFKSASRFQNCAPVPSYAILWMYGSHQLQHDCYGCYFIQFYGLHIQVEV